MFLSPMIFEMLQFLVLLLREKVVFWNLIRKNIRTNSTFIYRHEQENGVSVGYKMPESKSDRNKTFILHSMYQYVVDENFPKVMERSFVDGVLPKGIIDISYTVDLSGLKAVNLMK